MMGINLTLWGLALLWGAFLGLFYFGGLWVTLLYVRRTGNPKLWLGISFVVRLSLALAGLWLVVREDPGAFLVALAAFFIIRTILTRTLGRENRGKTHGHQS